MTATAVQLDLFVNEEIQREKLEQAEFKKNVTKSIRGLFARYNEIEYAILEMHKKIERLNESVYINE